MSISRSGMFNKEAKMRQLLAFVSLLIALPAFAQDYRVYGQPIYESAPGIIVSAKVIDFCAEGDDTNDGSGGVYFGPADYTFTEATRIADCDAKDSASGAAAEAVPPEDSGTDYTATQLLCKVFGTHVDGTTTLIITFWDDQVQDTGSFCTTAISGTNDWCLSTAFVHTVSTGSKLHIKMQNSGNDTVQYIDCKVFTGP